MRKKLSEILEDKEDTIYDISHKDNDSSLSYFGSVYLLFNEEAHHYTLYTESINIIRPLPQMISFREKFIRAMNLYGRAANKPILLYNYIRFYIHGK
jgi:hypothetical protein